MVDEQVAQKCTSRLRKATEERADAHSLPFYRFGPSEGVVQGQAHQKALDVVVDEQTQENRNTQLRVRLQRNIHDEALGNFVERDCKNSLHTDQHEPRQGRVDVVMVVFSGIMVQMCVTEGFGLLAFQLCGCYLVLRIF